MTELLQQFRWRPEIGNPSLIADGVAHGGGLCSHGGHRAGRRAPGLAGGSRLIWLSVAALMIFLCLNKQLDLQSLLTEIGRSLSSELSNSPTSP